MRVIAGTARSLQLKTVPGMETRPTTDRIKETLFNILAPYIPDSEFLDLFSGSGGIGIEAISRGANKAYFVDNSRNANKVIHENLVHTRFLEQAEVLAYDCISAIRILEGRHGAFDVIFMDPPYNKELEKEVLSALAGSSLVDENTLIVVESSLETEFDYMDELPFYIDRVKEYKTNKHTFLYRES
jgi:16S rRNA (guanine(966)-N(2))-methyltransferase RsmD